MKKIAIPLEIDQPLALRLLQPRSAYGHKGTFGHLLIIAGRHGMMGAAVLAARAAMRSGVGKLTSLIPERAASILQIALPEAILQFDTQSAVEWQSPCFIEGYQALLIGPGIGQSGETQFALRTQLKMLIELEDAAPPLVLDADALNLVAQDYQLLSFCPKLSVLTPHRGEMQRLAASLGLPYQSEEEMFHSAQVIAQNLGVVMVLKGYETYVFLPDGLVFVNRLQGNSGMATAGSGDVLAGLVASLLAQGYSSSHAALLGVYLHAKAGDFARLQLGEHSLIASDLVDSLPQAFLSLSH